MVELIGLMGFKACGKSTIGPALARKIGWSFTDLDKDIEMAHTTARKEVLTFREIFQSYGAHYFRQLERETLSRVVGKTGQVIALGGGTVTEAGGDEYLSKVLLIYLEVRPEILWQRIIQGGIPSFLKGDNPELAFEKLLIQREAVYGRLAHLIIDNSDRTPEKVVDEIIERIEEIETIPYLNQEINGNG